MDQGGEILRMLRAVLRADRHAQHHRHRQLAGGHRLPLRELVEDLVAGASHEVGIHQLGDDAAAFEGVADGGADDRRFRDRRVEQPMVGQRFGQAAIHGEGAAPVAVLLAERDHRRIDREAVQQRLEQRIADVVGLHLRDGMAVVRSACESCRESAAPAGCRRAAAGTRARARRISRPAGSRTSPSPRARNPAATRGLTSRSTDEPQHLDDRRFELGARRVQRRFLDDAVRRSVWRGTP